MTERKKINSSACGTNTHNEPPMHTRRGSLVDVYARVIEEDAHDGRVTFLGSNNKRENITLQYGYRAGR